MTQAGYSGTPLGKKLGIKTTHVVWLETAPASVAQVLTSEIAATYRDTPPSMADVIVLFVRTVEELQKSFPVAAEVLIMNGGLWVCWPKKASGVETDLSENLIRDFGLEIGLVDNKVCAIDQVWSGLRFVYRLKDR